MSSTYRQGLATNDIQVICREGGGEGTYRSEITEGIVNYYRPGYTLWGDSKEHM